VGIEALKVKATEELAKLKFADQLVLFPQLRSGPKARLVNWRLTGYHQVFGSVYDRLGFPKNLLRDLVVARIVYPKSKLATVRYLNRFLGLSLKKDTVYRFMDSLSKDELVKIAFEFVSQRQQGLSLVFYDVTTLYFESEKEDLFRKKGFSKDHQFETPQILVGLFVDDHGYPFDFDLFPGNTFEGHTFKTALCSLLEKYHFDRLTVVADAGMLSEENLAFLASLNLGYIVAARLKNLDQKLTTKILAHDFSKKSTYQTRLKDRRLIVHFSFNRAKQDKANRDRLIKKLKLKLALNQPVIRHSKYLAFAQPGKAMGVDQTKVKADAQFDGLKGYFTNTSLSAKQVIGQYHYLWQIEKAFRMSKSDLKERPVYHYRLKRIKAHLLVCFVSLLVMKETERKLSQKNYSLEKAIEMLAKVGQGTIRIGKAELEIDSELDKETKSILKIFVGH
jgi:transposase